MVRCWNARGTGRGCGRGHGQGRWRRRCWSGGWSASRQWTQQSLLAPLPIRRGSGFALWPWWCRRDGVRLQCSFGSGRLSAGSGRLKLRKTKRVCVGGGSRHLTGWTTTSWCASLLRGPVLALASPTWSWSHSRLDHPRNRAVAKGVHSHWEGRSRAQVDESFGCGGLAKVLHQSSIEYHRSRGHCRSAESLLGERCLVEPCE